MDESMKGDFSTEEIIQNEVAQEEQSNNVRKKNI